MLSAVPKPLKGVGQSLRSVSGLSPRVGSGSRGSLREELQGPGEEVYLLMHMQTVTRR